MSLLGRLLSAAGSSAPSSVLDSSLEDQFTYNLLFPDRETVSYRDEILNLTSDTILDPAPITNFDINAAIDLDMRDVRVIIMQEATPLSGSAYLLYDSHALPSSPIITNADTQATKNAASNSSVGESCRSFSSLHKSSEVYSKPFIIQQENPAPRTFGAFERRAQHTKIPNHNETDSQRSAREYREEVTTFSNCIFGNSDVLAYKGTGTKVHVLPSESRLPLVSSSYVGDGNGSFGRSGMRSSRLGQSFTSDTIHRTSTGFPSPTTIARNPDRRKVLITRMFPVTLPDYTTDDVAPYTGAVQSPEIPGYPFPEVTSHEPQEERSFLPKQKRTPMYAVGMVINLPLYTGNFVAPASRSSFRGSSSFTEHESYPSSFNSARRSGWTMLGHGLGTDSLDSYSIDDDRIDTVVQHWDIIMRTLSHLQAVATASLLPMLKHSDASSPEPSRECMHTRTLSSSVSVSGKRVAEDTKIPITNAKMVQLTTNCLMNVETIKKQVDKSRQRIVSGIRARRVVTGQGRWGIWRDQARVVANLAGGKDQGFFFFNLLTAFLGNHTEWLQVLGPSWYRRRYHQQQRASKDGEITLPARTIIISDNKIMARRLIFLLSAFFPAHQPNGNSRMHRPSTSISFGVFSESPPTYAVPILREDSLRRRINKRAPTSRRHSRKLSFPNQTAQGNSTTTPVTHHECQPPDAPVIRTANLPIPGSDLGTRKSSTAATTMVTPMTTMPHFSTRRSVKGTGPIPRPGSSGSLATNDLLRTLGRVGSTEKPDTAEADQSQISGWGSMISGFWCSSKKIDTSSMIETDSASMECLETCDTFHIGKSSHSRDKLKKHANEAHCILVNKSTEKQDYETGKLRDGNAVSAEVQNLPNQDISEQVINLRQRLPYPSGAYESPVKTSINKEDGVIDIDVPLPDYLGFETAVSSPSSSDYLSTAGLSLGVESFEQLSRVGPDADATLNVGGWFQRYNPDFTLQAIPCYEDLLEEVKASLRSEPTPSFSNPPNPDGSRTERWVDVSSAVVADTTNFTIRRILHRRLLRPKRADYSVSGNSYSFDSRHRSAYSVSGRATPLMDYWEDQKDEQFIEEPIISMDETLIEAVEKIIALSSRASKTSSECSSRSTSRKGDHRGRSNSDLRGSRLMATSQAGKGIEYPPLEVPRNECKSMVLGALEEIIREVAEGRDDKGEIENGSERESFLREGVRNWLINIETTE